MNRIRKGFGISIWTEGAMHISASIWHQKLVRPAKICGSLTENCNSICSFFNRQDFSFVTLLTMCDLYCSTTQFINILFCHKYKSCLWMYQNLWSSLISNTSNCVISYCHSSSSFILAFKIIKLKSFFLGILYYFQPLKETMAHTKWLYWQNLNVLETDFIKEAMACHLNTRAKIYKL